MAQGRFEEEKPHGFFSEIISKIYSIIILSDILSYFVQSFESFAEKMIKIGFTRPIHTSNASNFRYIVCINL